MQESNYEHPDKYFIEHCALDGVFVFKTWYHRTLFVLELLRRAPTRVRDIQGASDYRLFEWEIKNSDGKMLAIVVGPHGCFARDPNTISISNMEQVDDYIRKRI